MTSDTSCLSDRLVIGGQPCTARARPDDPRVLTETRVRRAARRPPRRSPTRPTGPAATLISAIGAAYTSGPPIPDVTYAPEEDAVWRIVAARAGRASTSATPAGPSSTAPTALDLRRDRVPQLAEVSERLTGLTGWRIEPVPGPGARPARSTARWPIAGSCRRQYIRHHSVPFYTPEPDVIHEVVGHANGLAEPDARRRSTRPPGGHRAGPRPAPRRSTSSAGCSGSRSEFGVAWEGGELRTYGAGLLSSYGELDAFRAAELRPFDLVAMGTQRLRHHAVPAGAVRGHVVRRGRPTGSARSSPATATSAFERLTGRPAA